MLRQYSYFKTQVPTDENIDFTQTVVKGFEFIPAGTIVTKFSITAETNLKLIVKNGNVIMTLYLKEGSTWHIENDDVYSFESIKCDSTEARVTYMLGYRQK